MSPDITRGRVTIDIGVSKDAALKTRSTTLSAGSTVVLLDRRHAFPARNGSAGRMGTGEIIRLSDRPIEGLDQLTQYLEKRGPLFFSTLDAINIDNKNFGWEKIEGHGEEFRKVESANNPGAIFTGRGLCLVSCFALYDGLKDKVRGVEFDVVHIVTDMQAERWDDPEYEPEAFGHLLFKGMDLTTRATRYYDPTYRQIDHRFPGTILSLSADELGTYYRDTEGPIDPVSISEGNPYLRYQKGDSLDLLLEEKGLTKEKYEHLLKTL